MELVTSFIIYFIGFLIIIVTISFYFDIYQNFFIWLERKWNISNSNNKLWIVFIILNIIIIFYIIYT